LALRKIATIGHPALRQVARELTRDELASAPMQRLVDDLVDTMRDANGAGLAANQVHDPARICAIEIKDNARYPYMPSWPLTILVNPIVEPTTDETFGNYEGCLSVPDLRGEVPRFAGIRVRAWDRRGKDLDFEVRGVTAGTFQHELDHLDGRLFIDRVVDTRTLCTWSAFERFHRDAFVERAKALIARFGA
jgi:peptide deformylase